jgi:hypothetical protein
VADVVRRLAGAPFAWGLAGGYAPRCSSSPRPTAGAQKDERDFEVCLPLLGPPARGWLRDQLRLLYPDDHPWRVRLKEA